MKKFEEGIFSDLRNLKPGVDASLEEPKVSVHPSQAFSFLRREFGLGGEFLRFGTRQVGGKEEG